MGRDRDSHYFLSLKSFPPFLLLCHAIAVALSFLTLLTSKASPHFSFFVLYFFKILGHNPGLYISCCKPLNWSTYHAHSHGKRRQLLLLAFSFFLFFFVVYMPEITRPIWVSVPVPLCTVLFVHIKLMFCFFSFSSLLLSGQSFDYESGMAVSHMTACVCFSLTWSAIQ